MIAKCWTTDRALRVRRIGPALPVELDEIDRLGAEPHGQDVQPHVFDPEQTGQRRIVADDLPHRLELQRIPEEGFGARDIGDGDGDPIDLDRPRVRSSGDGREQDGDEQRAKHQGNNRRNKRSRNNPGVPGCVRFLDHFTALLSCVV